MSPVLRNRNTRALLGGILLLLLTVALVKMLSAAPANPVSSTGPATGSTFVDTKCADLVVLGLRGAGQLASKNEGVGGEVLKTVENVATRLHTESGATVRIEGVDYRSSRDASYADYHAGVLDGRRKLGAQYEQLSKECGNSKIAIIGFSKGAQVAHEFAYDLSKEQSQNLVLIAMIADPLRNPADGIIAWSYAKQPAPQPGKLGAGPRFGSATRQRAITLCVAKDEVCNRLRTGGPTSLSETHKKFYELPGTVRSSGRQLIAVLHRNGFR